MSELLASQQEVIKDIRKLRVRIGKDGAKKKNKQGYYKCRWTKLCSLWAHFQSNHERICKEVNPHESYFTENTYKKIKKSYLIIKKQLKDGFEKVRMAENRSLEHSEPENGEPRPDECPLERNDGELAEKTPVRKNLYDDMPSIISPLSARPLSLQQLCKPVKLDSETQTRLEWVGEVLLRYRCFGFQYKNVAESVSPQVLTYMRRVALKEIGRKLQCAGAAAETCLEHYVAVYTAHIRHIRRAHMSGWPRWLLLAHRALGASTHSQEPMDDESLELVASMLDIIEDILRKNPYASEKCIIYNAASAVRSGRQALVEWWNSARKQLWASVVNENQFIKPSRLASSALLLETAIQFEFESAQPQWNEAAIMYRANGISVCVPSLRCRWVALRAAAVDAVLNSWRHPPLDAPHPLYVKVVQSFPHIIAGHISIERWMSQISHPEDLPPEGGKSNENNETTTISTEKSTETNKNQENITEELTSEDKDIEELNNDIDNIILNSSKGDDSDSNTHDRNERTTVTVADVAKLLKDETVLKPGTPYWKPKPRFKKKPTQSVLDVAKYYNEKRYIAKNSMLASMLNTQDSEQTSTNPEENMSKSINIPLTQVCGISMLYGLLGERGKETEVKETPIPELTVLDPEKAEVEISFDDDDDDIMETDTSNTNIDTNTNQVIETARQNIMEDLQSDKNSDKVIENSKQTITEDSSNDSNSNQIKIAKQNIIKDLFSKNDNDNENDSDLDSSEGNLVINEENLENNEPNVKIETEKDESNTKHEENNLNDIINDCIKKQFENFKESEKNDNISSDKKLLFHPKVVLKKLESRPFWRRHQRNGVIDTNVISSCEYERKRSISTSDLHIDGAKRPCKRKSKGSDLVSIEGAVSEVEKKRCLRVTVERLPNDVIKRYLKASNSLGVEIDDIETDILLEGDKCDVVPDTEQLLQYIDYLKECDQEKFIEKSDPKLRLQAMLTRIHTPLKTPEFSFIPVLWKVTAAGTKKPYAKTRELGKSKRQAKLAAGAEESRNTNSNSTSDSTSDSASKPTQYEDSYQEWLRQKSLCNQYFTLPNMTEKEAPQTRKENKKTGTQTNIPRTVTNIDLTASDSDSDSDSDNCLEIDEDAKDNFDIDIVKNDPEEELARKTGEPNVKKQDSSKTIEIFDSEGTCKTTDLGENVEMKTASDDNALLTPVIENVYTVKDVSNLSVNTDPESTNIDSDSDSSRAANVFCDDDLNDINDEIDSVDHIQKEMAKIDEMASKANVDDIKVTETLNKPRPRLKIKTNIFKSKHINSVPKKIDLSTSVNLINSNLKATDNPTETIKPMQPNIKIGIPKFSTANKGKQMKPSELSKEDSNHPNSKAQRYINVKNVFVKPNTMKQLMTQNNVSTDKQNIVTMDEFMKQRRAIAYQNIIRDEKAMKNISLHKPANQVQSTVNPVRQNMNYVNQTLVNNQSDSKSNTNQNINNSLHKPANQVQSTVNPVRQNMNYVNQTLVNNQSDSKSNTNQNINNSLHKPANQVQSTVNPVRQNMNYVNQTLVNNQSDSKSNTNQNINMIQTNQNMNPLNVFPFYQMNQNLTMNPSNVVQSNQNMNQNLIFNPIMNPHVIMQPHFVFNPNLTPIIANQNYMNSQQQTGEIKPDLLQQNLTANSINTAQTDTSNPQNLIPGSNMNPNVIQMNSQNMNSVVNAQNQQLLQEMFRQQYPGLVQNMSGVRTVYPVNQNPTFSIPISVSVNTGNPVLQISPIAGYNSLNHIQISQQVDQTNQPLVSLNISSPSSNEKPRIYINKHLKYNPNVKNPSKKPTTVHTPNEQDSSSGSEKNYDDIAKFVIKKPENVITQPQVPTKVYMKIQKPDNIRTGKERSTNERPLLKDKLSNINSPRQGSSSNKELLSNKGPSSNNEGPLSDEGSTSNSSVELPSNIATSSKHGTKSALQVSPLKLNENTQANPESSINKNQSKKEDPLISPSSNQESLSNPGSLSKSRISKSNEIDNESNDDVISQYVVSEMTLHASNETDATNKSSGFPPRGAPLRPPQLPPGAPLLMMDAAKVPLCVAVDCYLVTRQPIPISQPSFYSVGKNGTMTPVLFDDAPVSVADRSKESANETATRGRLSKSEMKAYGLELRSGKLYKRINKNTLACVLSVIGSPRAAPPGPAFVLDLSSGRFSPAVVVAKRDLAPREGGATIHQTIIKVQHDVYVSFKNITELPDDNVKEVITLDSDDES